MTDLCTCQTCTLHRAAVAKLGRPWGPADGANIGLRVRFVVPFTIGAAPFTVIEPGETGTVNSPDDGSGTLAITLDNYYPTLREWDNEAHFYDGPEFWDVDPADYLEVIA